MPTEEKTSSEIATSERETEEKTSAWPGRNKRYDGSGRRNTDDEIDEILDWYITTGELPLDVSDRQRRDYKKHPRLELRRMYLEQAGLIKKGRSNKRSTPPSAENRSNVLDMAERKAKRAKSAS